MGACPRQLRQHDSEHSLHILQHVRVPETKHAVSASPQPGITPGIRPASLVLATVELDHQTPFDAGEVGDEGADGNLAPEAASGLAPSETFP